jgi:putative heme iron utilization protein
VDATSPEQAQQARGLLASMRAGTLSTLARDPAGHPYGSLVPFALDGARPVLLLSELAEHTKNLRADPRASLLVAEAGSDQPLARGRVTLLGTCQVLNSSGREQAERAYVARFPEAAAFAGLGDFRFWVLQVSTARFIAGFARMSWISAAEWAAACTPGAARGA